MKFHAVPKPGRPEHKLSHLHEDDHGSCVLPEAGSHSQGQDAHHDDDDDDDDRDGRR